MSRKEKIWVIIIKNYFLG